MRSTIKKEKIVIPTYPVGAPEPLPVFFEKRPYQGASGKVYPIPYTSVLGDERDDNREYDAIVLENDWVKVELLPEIGGKVHGAVDKTNGYEYVYTNKVIKPAMVGLAGPWVSGGIEFNFPQHHRPTTFMPAEWAIAGEGDDKRAVMGETDFFYGLKGMAELSLVPDTNCLRARVTVYNGTPVERPFMWWANLAVEVNDDYNIVFPPDVETVNDHDRRAVLEWPIASGTYHTARPFDYGRGTDIHRFNAVKVPSSFMISRGQSDEDFVAGYDTGKRAGIVTVANHHVSPGKKLWTWGDGKFGAKWCSNLTDDGTRYVELMTGVYTDNQPDFTWIAPHETKVFEQFWFPVREIGEVKRATEKGAVNLEKTGNGAFAGFYSTSKGVFDIEITSGNNTILKEKTEVSPEKPFTASVGFAGDFDSLKLTVKRGGKTVIEYSPIVKQGKKPIEPRKPAPKPSDISSNEELWLHGMHLRQYKHFAYRPEDYFTEALRRDKHDIRCNRAMGDICYDKGMLNEAIGYYTASIERLRLRNQNPEDTGALYRRALCKFRLGDETGAYDDAYAAAWGYANRSAAYYLLAKIDAKRGNKAQAIEFLRLALETNARDLRVRYALALLTDDRCALDKIEADDPLFIPAKGDERRAIEFAIELHDFGFDKLAAKFLSEANDGAGKFYYLAYLSRGKKRKEYLAAADACPWQCAFPSRIESIAVLEAAGTPMANYYLGCLLYSFEQYSEAAKAWEKTVKAIEFAPAYRNLALAYFDHLSEPLRARKNLERARKLMPESGRIFFELTQLYRALDLPLDERIALYESDPELTATRDDCTLQYSVLLTEKGEYEKAKAVLDAHRFHTYEGGEGNLTQHHAWLYFLRGLAEKDEAKRAEILRAGLVFPENYGEEKNYFVNDAPIYFTLYELGGEDKKADLEAAVSTKGAPTIHSYWQTLAYRARGEADRAVGLANEMIAIGENKIARADVNDYYGVGAPAYQPFNYDIVKAHVLAGSMMCAFGHLARGEKEKALAYAAAARKIDCADFALYLFDKVARG